MSGARRAGPNSGVRTRARIWRTTVTGLPVDGRTLYVRLWSVIGGVWSFTDYTYTATGPYENPASAGLSERWAVLGSNQ